jgi:hypothetical protein
LCFEVAPALDHPMLDVRVFRNLRFSAASISITFVFFALGTKFTVASGLATIAGAFVHAMTTTSTLAAVAPHVRARTRPRLRPRATASPRGCSWR